VVEAHDAVADGKFGDACADFGDHAGHLVAEDARRGVRAHVNFLEIRSADAAGGDLDEQFAGVRCAERGRFQGACH
jgi:hypothetical protein